MMMRKVVKKVKKVALGKKKLDALKAPPDPTFHTHIRARLATAAPPLGPALGQRGVNVANFCKEFNNQTANMKLGTLLPVSVHVKPDRTYDCEIQTPTTEWLLKQAAGFRRSKQDKDEITGILSVKHIYEISQIKSADKTLIGVPLKEICEMIIERATTLGIKVQNEDMDPIKYKEFLEKRQQIVKEQLEEIEKQEASKLLRT